MLPVLLVAVFGLAAEVAIKVEIPGAATEAGMRVDAASPWERFTTVEPPSGVSYLDDDEDGDGYASVYEDAESAQTSTAAPIPGLEGVPDELRAFAELAEANSAAEAADEAKAVARAHLPADIQQYVPYATNSTLPDVVAMDGLAAAKPDPADAVDWSFTDVTTGMSFLEMPTSVERYHAFAERSIDNDLIGLEAFTTDKPELSFDIAAETHRPDSALPAGELDADSSLVEGGVQAGLLAEVHREVPRPMNLSFSEVESGQQAKAAAATSQAAAVGALGRLLEFFGAPLDEPLVASPVEGVF